MTNSLIQFLGSADIRYGLAVIAFGLWLLGFFIEFPNANLTSPTLLIFLVLMLTSAQGINTSNELEELKTKLNSMQKGEA